MNQQRVPVSDYIVPPCKEEVGLLYEDKDILVVNKPSGLLSVPGKKKENNDCVISRIQKQFPTATIVHRLDLDTSGLMLIPLNKEAHRQLGKQFEKRQIHKQYHAIVYGLVKQDKGKIELPICCNWPNRPMQKVDFDNGKSALTYYQVLNRSESSYQTRVLFEPVTGRSHQLRIHASAIEHPILGCDFYAHQKAFEMAPRLMLYASQLVFLHPIHQKEMSLNSPLPF